MDKAKPLPSFLVKRYHGWRATEFDENKAWYRRLAEAGQHPRTMVISCCDSRVHVTSIFGAETGEFFIHRNIAALVPPFAPNKDFHGTSAAIEYAVNHLGVANILIVGHSGCGGVSSCDAMCSGKAPDLVESSSFIGRWLDILKPGYERIKGMHKSHDAHLTALEQEAVRQGLDNLMTFPFVKEAVETDRLDLHGLWTDISDGSVQCYMADEKAFRSI